MEKLSGMWKGKEGGKVFASCKLKKSEVGEAFGKIEGDFVKVLVFKNDKKTEDRHPDFNVCIAEVDDQKPKRDF
jgi:hypothetical protein